MLLFENEGYDAIDLLLVNRAANRTDENDYVSDESLKKKMLDFFFFFVMLSYLDLQYGMLKQ